MKPINWETILSDIAEARSELEMIEKDVKSGTPPSEIDFKVRLRHAYHHVNFAWNCRHVATTNYASMSDKDFKKWGRYPKDIEKL